jgi:hypothetical protein
MSGTGFSSLGNRWCQNVTNSLESFSPEGLSQAREREAGKKMEQYERIDPCAQAAYIKRHFGQTSRIKRSILMSSFHLRLALSVGHFPSDKNAVCISHPSHAYCTSRPVHRQRYDQPNNIWL